MFKRIFGERKSIQRSLLTAFIIAILLVEVVSFVSLHLSSERGIINESIKFNIESREAVKSFLMFFLKATVIGIINVVLIGGIVMRVMSKKILKPIQRLMGATQKVSEGDFSVKLQTDREDEIGELTNNFNKMVSELGSTENLQKQFVDNVSHEIKTPISSIQGFAELLRDEKLSKEEKEEYINIIQEESNRLLKLSTNMLKLSKLQNQSRITNKEQINVAEQIRKTISLLEPKWKEKEIIFNISMEEKYFYGDEDLLFQVWVNLIENAIKFSKDNGKINIDVKERENMIEIKIKDYGFGMDEEEMKKIFTRFYQIDKSHSEKGHGLGLAIVKRIVELSRGTIDVESQKNIGTTITVKLPLEDEYEVLVV